MNILNIVPVSSTIPNVAQYGCQGLQLKNSVKCLRLYYTHPHPAWPPAPPPKQTKQTNNKQNKDK